MPTDPLVGWDVGGAHLKAARVDRHGELTTVIQLPCPLWQGLSHLESALHLAQETVGAAPCHAITMTGEMTDLFADRTAGVIALAAALAGGLSARWVRFYAGDAGFVTLDGVPAVADRIASANWRATAALVASQLPAGLLVDIGSTTTDLVPVAGGRVAGRGADDYSRLLAGELVYTGVVRTPLMALGEAVAFGADRVPLIAEYFATTADVYRITGELPDGADQHPAADGGAQDPAASARRLGRMIGRDLPTATWTEWVTLARAFRALQLGRLRQALVRQLERRELPAEAPLVGAGVGRFLAAELAGELGRPFVDFADLIRAPEPLRDRAADCAPAVAVALLAVRRELPG